MEQPWRSRAPTPTSPIPVLRVGGVGRVARGRVRVGRSVRQRAFDGNHVSDDEARPRTGRAGRSVGG
jgi:hypothetical protein